MANLYGVANAPGLPVYAQLTTGAVAIPAGTMTSAVTSSPLIAPSQGYFYAILWALLEVQFGAVAPSGLAFAAAIGGGSFQNITGPGTAGIAANSSFYITPITWTAPSQVAWQGAGSTVSLGVQATAQAITVQQYSGFVTALYRAPDQ